MKVNSDLKKISLVAVVLSAANCHANAQEGVNFDNGINLQAEAVTGLGYSDNVYRSNESEENAFYSEISPRINITSQPFNIKNVLSLDIKSRLHLQKSNLNYTDANTNWYIQLLDSQRHLLSLDLSYNYTHDDPGTGSIQFISNLNEPIFYTNYNLSSSYQYGVQKSNFNYGLDFGISKKKYKNFLHIFGELNNEQFSVSPTISYTLRSGSSVRSGVRKVIVNYPNAETITRDSEGLRTFLGTRLLLINDFIVDLDFGYEDRKFKDVDRGGFQGITSSINISKPISYQDRLSLDYSRRISESIFSTSLRVSNGISISWNREFGQSNLSTKFEFNEDSVDGEESLKQYIKSISISYEKNINEKLKFILQALVSDRNSYLQQNSYNLNNINLGLTYTL